MSLIENFMKRYVKEYDYYRELSRLCAEIIESKLENNGIRAIVTYRAKRPDRLQTKLESRIKAKEFKRIEQIYSDIVDFSGIRIALYFPSDANEVKRIIEADFDIVKVKNFPEKDKTLDGKRFSGYWANHYRCSLKQDRLKRSDVRYSESCIEIQVASVLMHAWSEVEHDLVYKPLSGKVSEEELAILDQLNGLVMTGEIALERLQRAMSMRATQSNQAFNNHYELATFLYSKFSGDDDRKIENLVLGRVDILFKFLSEIDKQRSSEIEPYLEYHYDIDDERSIVDQMVDFIIDEKIELYTTYQHVRKGLENRSTHREKKNKTNIIKNEIISDFLKKWIELEQLMRFFQNDYDNNRGLPLTKVEKELMNQFGHESNVFRNLPYIRRFRNQLVHGIERPSIQNLKKAINELELMIHELDELKIDGNDS